MVNLLQCRPLYLNKSGETIDLKTLKPKMVFFDIVDSAMGTSCKRRMDVVVHIDPVLYYQYPYQKKYQVVQAVEAVNDFYKGSGKNLLLMTPGRGGYILARIGGSRDLPQYFIFFRCVRGVRKPGGVYAGAELWQPYVSGSCGSPDPLRSGLQ